MALATHLRAGEYQPQSVDIGQVREICEARKIHTVECSFPDPHGIPRGKRIPTRNFLERAYQGFDICNAVLVWDRKCDILPTITYGNWQTGYPDIKAIADLSTFRPIPWRPGAASVICDCFEEDGSEARVSTRYVLKSLVAKARALGLEPKFGSELEFYVLDGANQPVYSEIDCYSLSRGAVLESFLERARRELEEFGIQIEACNTEYGPAQVEVNIRYGDPLATADNTMLFKAAVKEIAAQTGYRVTFMAKPFADQSGSGYHVHQSLWDVDSRQNVFAGAHHGGVDGSPSMGAYLAGLLENMVSITALAAPTVNAYKRLRGYTFAPTRVSWGIDNRTVGVRALVGQEASNRLEWRNGSADANPYLIIAATLAAGLDGIRRGLEPPPAVIGDGYGRTDLESLPLTFDQALEALEASPFVGEVLGDFLDVFVALGRHEVNLWRTAVTDWDRVRYFDA